MSRYLEEAAELLRKADAGSASMSQARMQSLLQIAQQFATLAAIDKGLAPVDTVQDELRDITERPTT
jgi:hypothetical protein